MQLGQIDTSKVIYIYSNKRKKCMSKNDLTTPFTIRNPSTAFSDAHNKLSVLF